LFRRRTLSRVGNGRQLLFVTPPCLVSSSPGLTGKMVPTPRPIFLFLSQLLSLYSTLSLSQKHPYFHRTVRLVEKSNKAEPVKFAQGLRWNSPTELNRLSSASMRLDTIKHADKACHSPPIQTPIDPLCKRKDSGKRKTVRSLLFNMHGNEYSRSALRL
jgi:hypothetical protein